MSSSVLEELDPKMLTLSEALFGDMEVKNLNKTVKVKISKAILHFIDQFIQDLIIVCGYAMKFEPSLDEARYCILHLWRKSHLRANILAEAQLLESLQENFASDDEDYMPGKEERSDDDSYTSSDDNHDADEDNFTHASEVSEEEDDSSAESVQGDDVSESSEVNFDWSFESEPSVSNHLHSPSEAITETDFVSELIQYCQSEIQQRYRTNITIRRPIAEMFAQFLSHQLQLSFQNDSDSLFIRAGFPAFGLMNIVYSQKEEMREMRQVLEKQSEVLKNAELLREEFKSTATITENLKAVARNLYLENFDRGNMDTENDSSHQQTKLSNEEESATFVTPGRWKEKLPTSGNIPVIAIDKDKDIENLKTALKTEKESNFYLRLRHEELKLVMSRLNDLVYGKDILSASAPKDASSWENNSTGVTSYNKNNSSSRSDVPREINRKNDVIDVNDPKKSNIEDIIHNSEDSDTDDEYQRQHLPPVSSFVNATFSPPAILVKHSHKKRSLGDDAHDRSLAEDRESPILRYSYEFQEGSDNPRDLVGHIQRSTQNENMPPIKRPRRSMSLHARQQQPGPHTPTMFDR